MNCNDPLIGRIFCPFHKPYSDSHASPDVDLQLRHRYIRFSTDCEKYLQAVQTMKLLHPRLLDHLVTFNVRGRIFQTTLTTLRRFPHSIIYKMVDYDRHRNRVMSPQSSESPLAENDTFFIDRDPDLFAAILHYHDTE
jgi:BTB/POZ domain